ncbi:MAG: ABC transporter permease [Candidatus Dormibacteraeota bacterium]|nr:ABC transporter permease [Candidatus Dormibacteraeota bacterium]
MSAVASARRSRLPATRLLERNLTRYRRGWIVVVSGFGEPLFYLLGIGFGVGAFVGAVSENGHHLSYAAFVAPGLMASSTMNGALYETGFNFFYKLKYMKLYEGILATPLSIFDVALGEMAWALVRGNIYALAFLLVMLALGLINSPWALFALPASLLTGFAFSALGTAVTTFVRQWQDFDIVLTLLLPMILFSGTFYPVDLYPIPIQVLVELTPLYRGIDLLRSLTTGVIGPWVLMDVAYLAALGIGALWLATTRLNRLLLK